MQETRAKGGGEGGAARKTENASAVQKQNLVQLGEFSGFPGETSVYVHNCTAGCQGNESLICYLMSTTCPAYSLLLLEPILSLRHGGSSGCEQRRLPSDLAASCERVIRGLEL